MCTFWSVGMIWRQTETSANRPSSGPVGIIYCPVPLFAPSKIEREATDRIVTPEPRPPSSQDNSRPHSVAGRSQEATIDVSCSTDVPGLTVAWRDDAPTRLGLPDVGTSSAHVGEVSNGLCLGLGSHLTYLRS